MATRLYANNYASTITTAILAGATSIIVTSATGLPTITGSDYYYLTLDNLLGTTEIVKVTAAAGTTLTVVRAQEGTTAVAWAALTTIEMRPTATSLTDVAGAAGKLLVSDGTRWSNSTPKYPYSSAATNLKALVGDGTDYVERTVIQTVSAWVNTYTTGTTTIPLDDTIPQNTEGDQYLTVSITPTNASSLLRISVIVNASCSSNVTCFLSLYRDSGADAIATLLSANLNAVMNILTLNYVVSAGSTSATTFNVRMGPTSAATVRINGLGSRYGGGANATGIIVQETIA